MKSIKYEFLAEKHIGPTSIRLQNFIGRHFVNNGYRDMFYICVDFHQLSVDVISF